MTFFTLLMIVKKCQFTENIAKGLLLVVSVQSAEACSKSYQQSETEIFAKIING